MTRHWPDNRVGIRVALGVWAMLAVATPRAWADASYASANLAYKAERYDDAITQYEELITAGINHEHLYYNLGNAYFRAGKLGYAIYNYERALSLEPDLADARYNLSVARRAVAEDSGHPAISMHAEPWWMRIVTYLPMALLAWGFMLSNIALFGSLIAFRIWSNSRGVRLASSSAAAALVVLAVLLGGRIAYHERVQVGIVLPDDTAIHEGALEQSATRTSLPAGARVHILGSKSGWLRVRLGSDAEGWVPSQTIGRL